MTKFALMLILFNAEIDGTDFSWAIAGDMTYGECLDLMESKRPSAKDLYGDFPVFDLVCLPDTAGEN